MHFVENDPTLEYVGDGYYVPMETETLAREKVRAEIREAGWDFQEYVSGGRYACQVSPPLDEFERGFGFLVVGDVKSETMRQALENAKAWVAKGRPDLHAKAS